MKTLKTAAESSLAAVIRAAIGADADEEVVLITPQFTREPGDPAPSCPPRDFEALRKMGSTALAEMGCRRWSEADADGNVLMLLPGEWFSAIPNGTLLEDIMGRTEPFGDDTDDDIRSGCIAYGFRVHDDRSPGKEGP